MASTKKKTESAKWMDFLKPFMVALIGLFSAATFYLQHANSQNSDERMAVFESEIAALKSWKSTVEIDYKDFSNVLSDVRSDVSYIRGKLETLKGR
jgi:hypothetical protein